MSSPRASKLRRWGLRLLGFAVLCVILVLVARLWAGSVANERLEGEVARIHAAGDPVYLADAEPPQVPEAENAAPLLQEAFDLTQSEDDVLAENIEAWRTFEDDPFGADEETAGLFAAWVRQNEPALQVAAEALQRPRCRFDRKWTSVRDLEFKEIAGLQLLSRLWKSRAFLRARAGQTDAALDDCTHLLRLSTLTAEHPLLIDMLVAMGIGDVGAVAAQEIIRHGKPGKGALSTLVAFVDDAPHSGTFQRCTVLERAYVNSAYAAAVERPEDIARNLPLGASWTTTQGLALRVLPTAMIRLDQARFLARIGEALTLMQAPYRESKANWKAFTLPKDDQPWYASMSTSALALYPLVAWKVAQHAARMDLLRIALHVELFRMENGTLPESLAEIYFDVVPTDRFRNAPYVYRRLPDAKYVIYSVGPNGVDDNGSDGGDDIETQGDLTWRG